MSQSDLQAAYSALYTLLAAGSETWASRAYPDIAPAGTAYPYAIYYWLGGGETNRFIRPESSLLIGVKCVSNTLSEAMQGAARIEALLNDVERKGGLSGGDDWQIANVSREGLIHLVETPDGARVYHEGARYRFNMEAKP